MSCILWKPFFLLDLIVSCIIVRYKIVAFWLPFNFSDLQKKMYFATTVSVRLCYAVALYRLYFMCPKCCAYFGPLRCTYSTIVHSETALMTWSFCQSSVRYNFQKGRKVQLPALIGALVTCTYFGSVKKKGIFWIFTAISRWRIRP